MGGKLRSMTKPRQLSRQAIEEFKEIYREEFKVTLSDAEVQEIALRLLRFFGILYRAPRAVESESSISFL